MEKYASCLFPNCPEKIRQRDLFCQEHIHSNQLWKYYDISWVDKISRENELRRLSLLDPEDLEEIIRDIKIKKKRHCTIL